MRQVLPQFDVYAKTTRFDQLLIEPINIRASQINGCAYCLDMLTKDARAIGETEQRLYCLNTWRESPFYSDAERSVLELTEAVTLVATSRVDDELYKSVREHFDEKQYVDLIIIINTNNSWNRVAISMNSVPGNYKSSY